MKLKPKAYEELGKLSYAYALPIFIFTLVRPLVDKKLNLPQAVISLTISLLLIIVGTILINKGSE